MEIVLTRSEWHLDQGMVGYKRILEHSGEVVKVTEDGIVFEEHHLDKLPDAYFRFFLDRYSVSKREEQYISSLWKRFLKDKKTDQKKEIDQRFKDQYTTKVLKYFPDSKEGKLLVSYIEEFRKEKESSEKLHLLIKSIFNLTKTKEIDEKLTINYVKGVILGPYFGQVSFLNVVNYKLTIPEQIELLRKDYIQPIKEELRFHQLLYSATNSKDILDFLETVNHKGLQNLKRKIKKLSLPEIQKYVDEYVNRCSFFDNWYGFDNFNEGVFSPLAISFTNSINFSWESNGNSSIPISSLAKLILLCAPAGATISGSRSTFIQNEGSMIELIQINEHFSNEKQRDKVFDEIIFDLAREHQLKADYTTRHYLIVEYESDYQAKKTLLDYMVLTPELCRLFYEQHHYFDKISNRMKNGLIHDLLNNIDARYRIYSDLREKIKHEFSSIEIAYASIIRHLYQCYLKGGFQLVIDGKVESNKIWNLYFSAREIEQIIGEKKSQGLAYRLLNATKAGDKKQFMDTIMRIYISAEKPMPTLLLNVLHEEEMDFPTVANAWIAGLISKKNDRGDDFNE